MARLQQPRDLGWETQWTDARVIGLVDVDDARFRRVGDDIFEFRRLRDAAQRFRIAMGVERRLHGADDPAPLDDLAGYATALEHREQAVLRGELRRIAMRARQRDRDADVQPELFIGDVDHPVDEAAQKHPVADLQHADRQRLRREIRPR